VSERRLRSGEFALTLAALVAVGLGWWLFRVDESKPQESPAAPSSTPTATIASDASQATDHPDSPAARSNDTAAQLEQQRTLARLHAVYRDGSLRDTERDGRVVIGTNREPVPDIELRRMFDWYLAATGELTPAEIRMALLDDMQREWGSTLAQRLVDWFDRYAGYLQAAIGVRDSDHRVRLDKLAALRRQWLGEPAATAMFGSDEAYARHVIDRLTIAQDPVLSPEERAARLDALDRAGGAGSGAALESEAQREATSATRIDEQTRQLDARGADPTTRHAEREAQWGSDAAIRLDALDRQRAVWDERVAAYVRARARVRTDADDTDDAAALDRIRREMFDDAERRRIESLEAIGEI
jgi:lipase chaperone LimK